MQHTVEAQLATQLQTLIRTHLKRYHVSVEDLSRTIGYETWAIEGMLSQPHWNLQLCVMVAEALNMTIVVSDFDTV